MLRTKRDTERTAICERYSRRLRDKSNPKLFLAEADEWIGDSKIIYYRNRTETHGNIIIITLEDNAYSLYRFFQLGSNWECSCDVQNRELWDVFARVFHLLG